MSWKKASAGETVYNKCPTNATGQSHEPLGIFLSLLRIELLVFIYSEVAPKAEGS